MPQIAIRTKWRVQPAPAPTADGIHASVIHKLDALLRNPITLDRLEKAYGALQDGIAALPLTTDEFGYLTNRLDHALRYCRENVTGAAKYELRLVQRRLAGLA